MIQIEHRDCFVSLVWQVAQHKGERKTYAWQKRKILLKFYLEYIVSFLSIHIIWIDICFTCSSVFLFLFLSPSVSISFFTFFFCSSCLSVCYCVEVGDGTYSNVTEKRMDCARSTHSLTILMNRFPFTCAAASLALAVVTTTTTATIGKIRWL